MREFWLTRGWYLFWWTSAFVAARVALVQPIVNSNRKRQCCPHCCCQREQP